MNRSGLWQLPLYLFFASIANLVFLVRAIKDYRRKKQDAPAATALLVLAIAELIWAIPCFIQCFMTLISNKGNHWWVATENDTGCDIMGFYSVFASVSGQMLVTQLAAYSYSSVVLNAPWSVGRVAKVSALAYLLSLIYCILPFAGVGSYAPSGEGFCYIDWSNSALVLLMQMVTVPCMMATLFFYGSLTFSGTDIKQTTEKAVRRLWIAASLSYISAWILWIPAAFIGLGSDEPYPTMFPAGYMISGGVLGHAQAILNPIIYGVYWRSLFISDDDIESEVNTDRFVTDSDEFA